MSREVPSYAMLERREARTTTNASTTAPGHRAPVMSVAIGYTLRDFHTFVFILRCSYAGEAILLVDATAKRNESAIASGLRVSTHGRC